MSVEFDPNKLDFGETRWIVLEDANVEHLLDVFTTVDAGSDSVWVACVDFIAHLRLHKMRPTVLKPKIEGLPDGHHQKPRCLLELSQLLYSVGRYTECKRLLTHALRLAREQGSDYGVARTLRNLADANWRTGHIKDGIEAGREALGIYEGLGHTVGQADCLVDLAWLLCHDNQLDVAEEVTSRAICLIPEEGDQFIICQSHRVLGEIYQSKGEAKKAIHHFEEALRIATSFNWHDYLFWVHYNLAQLLLDEGRLDDGQAHVERAKSYAVDNTYNLGCMMELQAKVYWRGDRPGEAMSEALLAANVFEKLGAAEDLERCRRFIRCMQETKSSSHSGSSYARNQVPSSPNASYRYSVLSPCLP